MKNIKTYEQFEWGVFTSLLAGGFLINYILSKALNKWLDYKNFKSIINDQLYTESKWELSYEDDIINIYGNVDRQFKIDKKNKTFEYINDIRPLKVKLNNKKMKEILSGVEFIKKISESIEDCFYELQDEGFIVKLYKTDFKRKSFLIKIIKDENLSYINFIKIAPLLEEVLHKITSFYGVKLIKPEKLFFREDYYVSDYKEEYVKIENSISPKNKFIYDNKKSIIKIGDNEIKLNKNVSDIDQFFMGLKTILASFQLT